MRHARLQATMRNLGPAILAAALVATAIGCYQPRPVVVGASGKRYEIFDTRIVLVGDGGRALMVTVISEDAEKATAERVAADLIALYSPIAKESECDAIAFKARFETFGLGRLYSRALAYTVVYEWNERESAYRQP